MTALKVACLQMDIAWESPVANYEKVAGYAREARSNGADVLILPEMFATGFSMNPEVTAEDEPAASVEFLKATARSEDIAIIGGYVSKTDAGTGKNTAVVVDRKGELAGHYVKTHLFSFLGEDEVHEPGDGPVVIELGGVSFSFFICYDLRFPEIFREVCTDIHAAVVIASWPAERQSHWDTLLPARAVENQCYTFGVNRIGEGGGLSFDGGTVAINPEGSIIFQEYKKEALLYATVDTDVVETIRREKPFLDDMEF